MASDCPELSVLIPVTGDDPRVVELHSEVAPRLERLGVPLEYLYLLPARTGLLVDQARSLHELDPEHVRVLCFTQPVGEAAMLRAGFEAARGSLLLTIPAHFEADSSDLPKLYHALQDGADLAVGSRAGWGDPHWIQSHCFNRVISWATGAKLADIASRTRALRREVLEEIHVYGDFDRYLPVLAHRMGFAVREVPMRQHLRSRSPLLHRPRTYLWRSLDVLSVFFLSRFTRHPLRLFGGIGAVFTLLGALALTAAIGQRYSTGLPLSDRPILVLSALLIGMGVQLFTIGLLGELILFFHARTIRDYRIAAVYTAEGLGDGGGLGLGSSQLPPCG